MALRRSKKLALNLDAVRAVTYLKDGKKDGLLEVTHCCL
jgi:hypothetical protein